MKHNGVHGGMEIGKNVKGLWSYFRAIETPFCRKANYHVITMSTAQHTCAMQFEAAVITLRHLSVTFGYLHNNATGQFSQGMDM